MKSLRKYLMVVLCALFAVSVALFAASCGGERAEYTVSVYLQAGDDYALSEEHSYTETGDVGAEVTVTPKTVEGYVFNEAHEGNVLTLTLDRDAEKNAFALYYDVERAAVVHYDANAPRGTSASGRVQDTPISEDGSVTLAENGFTLRGYRFAGWSTQADGAVQYKAGETLTAATSMTLYAVWDRGYTDRFGGSDYIFVPSTEDGVVYLQRGEMEWKGTLTGNRFSFTKDDGSTLEGTLSDTRFTYVRPDLAGEYAYYNGYMTEQGGSYMPDPSEKLKVNADGTASYTHKNSSGNVETFDGIVTFISSGLYSFTANNPTADFEGFVYMVGLHPGEDENDTRDDVSVFSYTFGEGGFYNEFYTPDGRTGYVGEGFIEMDGFGNLIYWSDVFEGHYRVVNAYDNGFGAIMYKIEATITDEMEEFGRGQEFTISFYTLPISDGSYAYVEPHGEAGTYTNGSETLELDGFGILSDSAHYTDANGTHVGTYRVESSPRTGRTVVFTEIVESNGVAAEGMTRRFTITGTDGVLAFSEAEEEEACIEYLWLLGDGSGTMSYWPLLTVYETNAQDESGKTLGRKAEMYLLDENDGPYLAAKGYMTQERLRGGNGVTLWTWHRTEVVKDTNNQIAEEMVLLLDSAYDADYMTRNVYMVLERDGEKQYEDIFVEDDNGMDAGELWYLNVNWNTLGTVYIDENGNYYAGGFTVNRTAYVLGAVGYFIYYTENGSAEFVYFDVVTASNGKVESLTLLPQGASEDVGLLASNRGGVSSEATLVMRRNGQAAWSQLGDFLSESGYIMGTYERAGTTETGDNIYAFKNEEGVEEFRFVMYLMEMSTTDDQNAYAYFVYDEAASGTYTSAAGTLKLDGYRGAVYTDAKGSEWKGTFTLNADGSALFFTGGGDELVFALEGKSFSLLDGVYGEYSFETAGSAYDLSFDGRGGVKAYVNRREVGGGSYQITGYDPYELLLTLDLGLGEIDYVVTLRGSSCVAYDDRSGRVFVSKDWAVVTMDGYGSATYYSADGMSVRTAGVHYIDAANGYARLRYDDSFTDEYFIFDYEKGTFTHPTYTQDNYFFLSEDFNFLIFASDGNMLYQNTMCSYYIADGNAYVFVPNASTGMEDKYTFPAPTGAKSYTVRVRGDNNQMQEKTFYLCTDEDHSLMTQTIPVVLEGTITNGSQQIQATLSFTLNLLSYEQDMINTTLEIKSGEGQGSYSVTLCTSYWDSANRRYVRGASIMDPYDFKYYPIEVHYIQAGAGVAGKSTFAADASVENNMQDYSAYRSFLDEYRNSHDGANPSEEELAAAKIGSLVERYAGFGTVTFGDRLVSGTLYCGDETITFTNAKTYFIRSGDPGRRYIAIFEHNEETLAVIYEKEDEGFYNLYMVAKYSEYVSGDYIVGVNQFYYGGGFEFFRNYQKGDFCGVELFKNVNGAKGESIPAFDSYAYADGRAWVVEEKDDPDTGYLVNVTLDEDGVPTGASAKKYAFHQGHTDTTIADPAYVDFFVDDAGNIELVAYIYYRQVSDSLYPTYANITKVEKGADDHTFTVTVSDDGGQSFVITIQLGDNGEPRTDRAGDWYVTIT